MISAVFQVYTNWRDGVIPLDGCLAKEREYGFWQVKDCADRRPFACSKFKEEHLGKGRYFQSKK